MGKIKAIPLMDGRTLCYFRISSFLGPDLSPFGKLAFAYVNYTLVMLAFTAINVTYSALLAVISPSAEETAKAARYRFVFALIGTLTVGALATPIVNYWGRGNEVLGFRPTIILFAVLSVALFWATFFTAKERIRLQNIIVASNMT